MKKSIFILMTMLLSACHQHPPTKEALIGTWDVVSSTDMETGAVEMAESDDLEFVKIEPDSVYNSSNYAFAWRMEGDSIFLDESMSIYIKKLTKKELIVEFDFLGRTQLKLKKRT